MVLIVSIKDLLWYVENYYEFYILFINKILFLYNLKILM